MTHSLDGFLALQDSTSSDLGYMPEFVKIGEQLVDAYVNYWNTNKSIELSGAMVELGILSHRFGVDFDIERLTRRLSDMVDAL